MTQRHLIRDLADRLSNAMCILECVHRSLKELQDPSDTRLAGCPQCQPEVVSLEHAMALLLAIHAEMD